MWVIYAFATIICYSFFDVFLKMSSDKMHSSMNNVIVNIVAFFVGLVYLWYAKMQGEKVFSIKEGGMIPAVLAGIAVGLAGIFFVKMFASDVPVSLGVPIVRIGMVIGATMLGVFLLKEGLSIKLTFGALISLVGLYLIMTAK
jgi:uncharacterized membrane protein